MNWKQALALGMCSVGAYKGEPVAYLYNGVRLPKLPETDLQYAVIVSDGTNYHVCFKDSTYTTLDSGGINMWGTVEKYFYNDGEWQTHNGIAFTAVGIWADHDILNTDGSVYLAASAPIPVYE